MMIRKDDATWHEAVETAKFRALGDFRSGVFVRCKGHVNCLKQGLVVASTIVINLEAYLVFNMGKCKGCGKLGRMVPRGGESVSVHQFSLLLSPVVSVWDCVVRKMRYSYRPEWV
ncbi:hypothetical protein FEM48_Zijuj03G0162800 [Ziziphus jujuba var. spinosa]|uniref:Uncharacterized protein n=1 Tax=Ziziphus jujuba var. spinosa TaxID=714518 RepID=A0A978VRC0_ZIZJJ|nr:hypothetical protein FEM48_Zijuj03G0162800 [Ziziphus jujuba var. spinosa]